MEKMAREPTEVEGSGKGSLFSSKLPFASSGAISCHKGKPEKSLETLSWTAGGCGVFPPSQRGLWRAAFSGLDILSQRCGGNACGAAPHKAVTDL